MKLTKRERRLIQILCGMIVLFGYFYFLIEPQWQKLKELKETKEIYNDSIEDVEVSLESKDGIEKEIGGIQSEIDELKKSYFNSIDQGSIILLLDQWIETSGLNVPALTFSEYREELLVEETLEAISLTVPFEGDYRGLIELLKEIRSHEKRVLVSQLSIENNYDGSIKGNLLLDFYKLKDPKVVGEEHFIAEEISTQNKENPFNPFQGFVREIYNLEEPVEEIANDYIPSENRDVFEDYEEVTGQDQVEEKPKVTTITMGLNDFESLDSFFVGEPRDIVGDLVLDNNAQSGKYALRLDYDFLRPRQWAAVNVVFEGEPITIHSKPLGVQLSTYSYGESNHGIVLVLKDSKGQEYTVDLAQQVDWRGWKQLTAILPKDITYPAVLQRVYIEAKDFDPVTKGTLLLDQLQAIFPD